MLRLIGLDSRVIALASALAWRQARLVANLQPERGCNSPRRLLSWRRSTLDPRRHALPIGPRRTQYSCLLLHSSVTLWLSRLRTYRYTQFVTTSSLTFCRVASTQPLQVDPDRSRPLPSVPRTNSLPLRSVLSVTPLQLKEAEILERKAELRGPVGRRVGVLGPSLAAFGPKLFGHELLDGNTKNNRYEGDSPSDEPGVSQL